MQNLVNIFRNCR